MTLGIADRTGIAPDAGSAAHEQPVTNAPLIFFSSASGYTGRFADKLDTQTGRIPLHTSEPTLLAQRPYVLLLPTYGGTAAQPGAAARGAVPKQVIKFLNNEHNRSLIRGVIGAGNTNFGESYCLAADIVSAKCKVPVLYRFELMGTSDDVAKVNEGLEEFWTHQSQKPA
ncbi:class Ib ribonucleoside-diphosphate reductase assembly flavoprotein NrdI [Arthrobacter gengyunqii]|uniref:Protein NrdI n=1 Tax=Arthrobacter gengyunqii TaxID=2886940 RepID=A0A9X1M2C0_9MICC|nr:class Ib ribonucleoside-diphosphate reductase assembly flavoprotein NrdI [Arthrobacter gengyunqii]MCC3265313.1 class Ib ribonucleoside-diphosphate reductase assembly flavoprotein NrdI [Arthrobacter gengyunqii]MCC3270063.1 class Ib ribonucleoside-diphosphate reductase assembly flavoprotein NrdI [Arthrobacter gengyunqii]UOY95023.1 class Ib ribonucleoside-diphosphate reductase assembly flavoprotein NrdI [Arthrobacter gengyunqii]